MNWLSWCRARCLFFGALSLSFAFLPLNGQVVSVGGSGGVEVTDTITANGNEVIAMASAANVAFDLNGLVIVQAYLTVGGSTTHGSQGRDPIIAYSSVTVPTIVGQKYTLNGDYAACIYTSGDDDDGGDDDDDDDDDEQVAQPAFTPPSPTPCGGWYGSVTLTLQTGAPSIVSISPNTGTVGTSPSISVHGENLLDQFNVTSASVSGSGVSASVSSPDPDNPTVSLSIASNASSGTRSFTMSNSFGTSNAENFTVGYPAAAISSVTPSVWIAGQTFPVTITGTGFGTQPTVTLSALGVTPITTTTASDGMTINIPAVSVAASAPYEPVSVQVKPGYVGSSFICGTACTGNGSATSSTPVVQPFTPAPQIIFNGSFVSNTTQNVSAGQQISLFVAAPSGYSITSQQWSFGNQSDITGGFVATSASGQEAADPPLNTGALTFYWVVPGVDNETVSYTYTLSNGQSASTSVTFNVDGPTGNVLPNVFVNTTDAATSIKPTDDPTVPDTTLISMRGATIGPLYGVYFNTTNATPPTTNPGVYIFAQILNTVQYQIVGPPGLQKSLIANEQLDGGYPYPSNGSTSHDAPGHYVSNTYGESGENFAATMYVMWDPALPSNCVPAHVITTTAPYTYVPSTCTSMPVPLSSAQWGWSNGVINQGVDGAPNWTVTCGPGRKQMPQTSGYPTWSSCSTSKNANCR